MQTNKIIKMLHTWQQSIAIDSIISTFSAAGIVSQPMHANQLYYCSVDLSVSIHLTELDNMIQMQAEMMQITTPEESIGPHTAADAAASDSDSRPTLYPPNATWVHENQIRIPIAFGSEAVVKPKTCPKNPQNRHLP
jgi:hypothetical protein